MAGRSLRRRKLDDLTNSELLELPCGQLDEILDSTPEDISQPDQVETVVSGEMHLVDEVTDRDDGDTAISKGSEVVNIQAPPADLLNVIWQCLQKDREERRAERKQDEEIRRRDEEARLAAEKRNDERLAKLSENIISSAEIVSRQFSGELDKQVTIIGRKIGTLNESMTTLKRDTQLQIQSIRERVTELGACVSERVTEHEREGQSVQQKISRDIEAKAKEFVNEELSVLRARMAEEYPNSIREEVEAVGSRNQTRLTEFDTRLSQLRNQVEAISSSRVRLTPADRSQVGAATSSKDTDVGASSVNADCSTRNACMTGRSECDVVENRCDLHMMSHQPTPSNICSGERIELAHVTQPSCHGSVLTELQLPRFSDSGRQNVVQFICQLHDYLRLMNVEESLNYR
jgi:hypothetical protein